MAQPRTIVVTGGASGIGAATVAAFRALGDTVIVIDRNDPADYTADLTDESQVIATFAAITQQFGRLDVLVNNAGGGTPGSLENRSLSDWDLTLRLNLTSAFLCLREATPLLRVAGGAAVVNVASFAARYVSQTLGPDYTAAKSGLVGLTRHAALELARHRIRVNAVCPGPTLTPIMRRLRTLEQLEAVARIVPLGGWLSPEDIAGAIVFLSSAQAAMCTGSVLDVDGGVGLNMGAPPATAAPRATPA